jgi:hypothetical protein
MCDQSSTVVTPALIRAERTDQIADVDVLGTDHAAHGAQDVAHVVVEQTVGQAVADCALPHVPVRVDEPRHHDHVRGVDHLRVRADVRANRGDQAFLDQHVGGVEVADLRIEREDASALEQHATGLCCCGALRRLAVIPTAAEVRKPRRVNSITDSASPAPRA